MARYDYSSDAQEPRAADLLRCEHPECARIWWRAERPGPAPRFCSDRCKQADFRARGRLPNKTARAAYVAEQEHRRRVWLVRERAEWLAAERAREERRRDGFRAWSWDADREARVREARVREARSAVFRLSGLADDGTVPLPQAFRAALRLHHPDHNGDSPESAASLAALLRAKELLQDAGAWA